MGGVATPKSFRVSIPSKLGPLAIRSMTCLQRFGREWIVASGGGLLWVRGGRGLRFRDDNRNGRALAGGARLEAPARGGHRRPAADGLGARGLPLLRGGGR